MYHRRQGDFFMLELISETNYRETMENTVEPKLASIRE